MNRLAIGLLGPLTVERNGRALDLPRSRKTRALLGYLSATDRPQPRERLCAMFWDVPDDPRGALRWSLSKLRGLVDDETTRIVGDRATVAFDRRDAAVDLAAVEGLVARGLDGADVAEVERAAALFRGEFLEGLDLPRCPDFHAWRLAENERLRALHATLLRHLADRLADDPARAIAHASALVRLDPAAEPGHVAFVGLLARLGRRDEARRQAAVAERLLAEQGVEPSGALAAAWRETAPARAVRPEPRPAPVPEPAAAPVPAMELADGRPTVAVLPFEDMSGDETQRYFAEGLTQDIATNLARFSMFLIIATQSSFDLRGPHRSVEGAREALGATYVLNGSVRRSGGRVRIVANLHDTVSGTCVWSQRYDRDVEDVFAIQDDIARQIAAHLAGTVTSLTEVRSRIKPPDSMVAYDHFLRGLTALNRYRTEDLAAARAMFEQALRLDPGYAAAMFGMAQVHINRWFLDADETALNDAYDWAMKALHHDPDDAWCAMIAGRVLLHRRDFERARYYYERAVDLNPSCADILSSYSYLMVCLGRASEAVRYAREAMRLNPSHSAWYDENLGNALFARGDYEDAYQAFLRVPDSPAYLHGYMAAALARLGRLDEARAAVAKSIAMDPTQSVERHRKGEPFLRPEDMDDLLDALRLAGLPETHEGVLPGISARARPADPRANDPSRQVVRYCVTADSVRLALATTGQGPPLVRPGNWLTHLEYDLESPVWRHWIRELSADHTLVRYDERGNGLSDWTITDLSFEALVRDLEAVVDALGLERFPLFGASRGSAVAIAYAARHPERVSRMVLYGGFARGWARRGSAEEVARRSGLVALIEQGWGQDNPWFRQAFTSLFIPEATADQMAWFNELQRRTVSPANARRMQEVSGDVDVTALLPRIAAPTLIIHARDDAVVPFAEGRLLADGIPGARFVALDGRNHILLETEPAWPRMLAETRAFLAEETA